VRGIQFKLILVRCCCCCCKCGRQESGQLPRR
jgi:hypothetical protein